MVNNRVKILFLAGLGLMLFYRILDRLPFIPETIFSFDTSKILKIIAGLIFIFIAFWTYRKSKKSSL
ncbi:hypothetical protein SAMN04488104_100179 [Algoriphagus faecimaris]|uniref:Uncharacterized protein n=1 Tax=Algoriphagus faecimaris TaxID=686796 RepID=A0A1G6M9X3_9BACT|nr:hypothetical protein SAMN04488104_100179 [Algoriphagus faecimaris]